MKSIIFALWALTGIQHQAVAQNTLPEGTLQFEIQSWSSQCELSPEKPSDCTPAQGLGSLRIDVPLPVVLEPGQAAASNGVPFESEVNGKKILGHMKLFSVYPKVETTLPPYVQIRIELIAPVRAACLQSVRWQKPFFSPPMMCVGFESGQDKGTQFGVTVKTSHAVKN